MPAPNVLLLLADQWRGDCLGADGHPDVQTPFLDTLANRGARFTRAYTAVPSCIAARAAILTGMAQAHHGRVGYLDGVRWAYAHTLPGCFTQAGYETHCVGKMHVHPLRARLGFESIALHDGYLGYYQRDAVPAYSHQQVADDYCHFLLGQGHKTLTDTGLDCNGWPARAWPYDEALHPTQWAGDQAIDFLRRRDRDHPFFLTVSFVRPHPPLDAPQAYFDSYDPDALTPPIAGGDWEPALGPTDFAGIHGIPTEAQQRRAQQGYYACISQVDAQIGRLLSALQANGQLDNTYVLFASDHGEMLGDHHYFRKALPYEGSARVPFLLAGPGIPAGTVSAAPVELMDIMPTLLAAAGLSIPDTVDGQSVLPVLSGAAARSFVHGEHVYGDLSWHSLTTENDKFIWFSQTGEEQYFDLHTDPHELRNAIDDPACKDRTNQLRAWLVSTLASREEGFVQAGQLTAGRPQPPILSHLQPLVDQSF